MKSPDCPTCGGEFHTVRLRKEAIEYALGALGGASYDDICPGCRKVARKTEASSLESLGNEGVVVST